MSGLLRRIRRTRPAASQPAPERGAEPTEGAGRPQPDPTGAPGGQPPVPAGTDLDRLIGDRPATKRRGQLRRRLRHLRRVRELLLRDLGGLVFEIHRSGDAGSAAQSQLVGAKLHRLAGVDAELRDLESVLGDRRGLVVREPGIGGTCPACGEIFGSEARYCWACGTPVAPGAARPIVSTAAAALPALGAADREGTPTHVWTADPAPPAEPHIEGHGEEMPPPPPADPPTRAFDPPTRPLDAPTRPLDGSEWSPPAVPDPPRAERESSGSSGEPRPEPPRHEREWSGGGRAPGGSGEARPGDPLEHRP